MDGLKRIEIPRAYQAVFEALQEEIMSGRITLGEPLPTETDLAQRFGVTRHTVREGMRVLEQSGLVKRESGRRLCATLPNHDALAPSASRALVMQRVSFRELWEVALDLELCAIDLAMPRATPEFVAQLEANLAAMEAALAKGDSIIPLDIAFHGLIAQAANNRVLLLSREPVSLLFYPSLRRLFQHPLTQAISPLRLLEAHRYILEAVRANNAKAAHDWMKRHITDFRRGYEFAGIDLSERVESYR